MKAIRVYEAGAPDVMKVEEIADLQPQAGEVRVRIRAAGVNPVDTYFRSGTYPLPPSPFTPGIDGAGEIDALGDGVTQWKVGDRVYLGLKSSGSYAEQATAQSDAIYRLPDNISFAQGAALGVPYATAYLALFSKAKAQTENVVLVHGASGGVGLAALQICRAHGWKVLGTAGTREGRKLVEEQGAEAFDHTSPDYLQEIVGYNCGRGPDVILEMLANVNLAKDLNIVAPRGRIVVIGNRGEVQINPRDLMRKDASVTGILLFNATLQELNEAHSFIIDGLKGGMLNPTVRCELPLADAPHAHELVLKSGAGGKIVLVP
ncbi:MAG TPA: NADPH:quinone reductase [Abditibacteriaceae bacterium]